MRALCWLLIGTTLLAQAPAPAPSTTVPRPQGTYARIAVTQGGKRLGHIVFQLLDKDAPITTANFIGLAAGKKEWIDSRDGSKSHDPFYDGLNFHRVIPGFMIQGGDPIGTGQGGTEIIADEFKNGLKFDQPGRVAMAHSGPHTASCQFFITDAEVRRLDGQYSIFGQVVEGMDVVHAIALTTRDGSDRPLTPVRMKVTIERTE
jgi:peptidyl-prolyl cis-trans isomerase A (cyclophilin A)